MQPKVPLPFLFLAVFIPLISANVINNNETEERKPAPPTMGQAIAGFEEILQKSGQDKTLFKLRKTFLGGSTAALDTDCNFANMEEWIDQCDSLTSYLICYSNNKCGCLDFDRVARDFEGQPVFGDLIGQGRELLDLVGATLKTSYDTDLKKCAGDSGSICPTGGLPNLLSISKLPNDGDLIRAFNNMQCQAGSACKDIKDYEFNGMVGKCSGTNLAPLSIGLLFALASFISRFY